MGSLARKIKREQLKKLLKEAQKNPNMLQQMAPTTPNNSAASSNDLLVSDMEAVKKAIRVLDNHLWMFMEALSDKGILSWADVHAIEKKYSEREVIRKAKIQDYLTSEKPLSQILDELTEGPNLKGYEKLNINPIKELNLNPHEVANYIKERHPGLNKEDYLILGKKWNLDEEHFGFKIQS